MDDDKIYDIIGNAKAIVKGSLKNIGNPFIKASNEIKIKLELKSETKNILEDHNKRDKLDLDE